MVKKFFCLFLIVIYFSFSVSVTVYASGGYHDVNNSDSIQDPSGMDNWTLSEKMMYWNTNFFTIVDAITGLFWGNSTAKMDELFLRFSQAHSNKYDSYAEMLAAGTRYDDSTGEFVFDDLSLSFINFIKDSAEEEITYQYGYFPNNYSLPVDWFQTKTASDIVHNLIKNNPDKMFTLTRLVHGSGNNGGWSVPNYGYVPMVRIRYTDVAYAAVSVQGSNDVGTPKATLYNEDWDNNFTWHELIIFDSSNNTDLAGHLVYKNDSKEFVVITDKDAASDLDLSLVSTTVVSGTNSYLANLNPDVLASPFAHLNTSMVTSVAFTSFNGAVPIFVSETAMKKGTASGVEGQYMPNYTGQPITNNTISSSEINNFINNYNNYYGSGSGSGGGGSGSESSGNWLDSLLSALGKLWDIFMTLFSKVVDIIMSVIKFFTDTLSNAMDIIPSGFVGFLGALFPFIPKEWLTAVSLMLALLLIGTAIKVFRK